MSDDRCSWIRSVSPLGRTSLTGPSALTVAATGAVGDMGGPRAAHPAPKSVKTRAKTRLRGSVMRRSLAQPISSRDAGAGDGGSGIGGEVGNNVGHGVRADPGRPVRVGHGPSIAGRVHGA